MDCDKDFLKSFPLYIPARQELNQDLPRCREQDLRQNLMLGLSDQIRPVSTLWDHWQSLRTGRDLPFRQDINPGKLIRILGEVVIYEVCLPDRITVRLAGTSAEMRWQWHRQGHNILDALASDQGNWLIDQFRQVVETPCGCRVNYRHSFVDGTDARISSLLLPLDDAADRAKNYVIAVHHMEGVPGMRASLPATRSIEELNHCLFDLDNEMSLDISSAVETGQPLQAATN